MPVGHRATEFVQTFLAYFCQGLGEIRIKLLDFEESRLSSTSWVYLANQLKAWVRWKGLISKQEGILPAKDGVQLQHKPTWGLSQGPWVSELSAARVCGLTSSNTLGAGEMAQGLGAPAALPEDLSLIPSSYIRLHKPPVVPVQSQGIWWLLLATVDTPIHMAYTYTDKNKHVRVKW